MTGEWTVEQIIQIRQYYYAMCLELDGMLGVLLNALKESGTENNTFVVFTSDHGELAMEHRQYYKMSAYEGSSHVPLGNFSPYLVFTAYLLSSYFWTWG